jgi:hypothetical protein
MQRGALGMERTGRGTRTFSAGLLGLMLATAVLLMIVLLDSQPALAQADPGSETSYSEPLDSDLGLEVDNPGASVSDPAASTEPAAPQAPQAAQADARALLQQLDEPLDTTILARRMVEPPASDHSGGGGPQAGAPAPRPT